MNKWEYKVLIFETPGIAKELGTLSIADEEIILNNLGEEGWEVVSMTDYKVILKRQKS